MKKTIKSAVGLKYNADDNTSAPKVIVKGHGDIADQILSLAEDNGILIHEDPALMEVLKQLELGQDIPESLYFTIAELIAYSYVLQGKFPDTWEQPGIPNTI